MCVCVFLCLCVSQCVSSNTASPAIFQNVNFIRCMYIFVKVAGSRVSLTLVSHRQGVPQTSSHSSDTGGIFLERKIAPLHLLVVARFEDICLPLCACSPSRGTPHPLAMLFSHLFSRLTLYLLLGRYRRPLRRGVPARGQFY